MKLAIISPPQHYYWEDWCDMGIGNYHLCLARMATHPDYAKYYQHKGQHGETVIMDNGAAEEGTLTADELNAAAPVLGATVQVVPDVVNMRMSTQAAFVAHYRWLNRVRMIVPQGLSMEEWFDCLDYMLTNVSFHTYYIGISKYHPTPRLQLLREIERRGYHRLKVPGVNEPFKWHLLGYQPVAHKSPLEVMRELRKFSWIYGMDTAIPVGYGIAGADLNQPHHYSVQWNHPGLKGHEEANERIIDNIEALVRILS